VEALAAPLRLAVANEPERNGHGRGSAGRERDEHAPVVVVRREQVDQHGLRQPCPRAELELLHPAAFLDALERFCASGGGHLDPDTAAVPESWGAAVLAAGAGLVKSVVVDLFPAYDDDGGLLVALSSRS